MPLPDTASARDELPLVARFPALGRTPRASLGTFPSPIESLEGVAPRLWIKRDDLAGDPMGGNKVRALEFLLAQAGPGERVVTVGSAGSTHALAVATYARRLGARSYIGRWRQEMNPAAVHVAERVARVADASPTFSSVPFAYAWALAKRVRGARWIAAGGTTPIGMLGHVNAGLELVAQIDVGAMPRPDVVVVPLGTGGTMAGLALGFALAGMEVRVVGARVVPKIVGRARRVLRLADRAAALIERVARARVPRVNPRAIEVDDDAFGGAYGRETPAARRAAQRLRDGTGVTLDATYSAKAFATALDRAETRSGGGGTVLYWLTFDARILAGDPS